MVYVREAKAEDIFDIAPNLRPEDYTELSALGLYDAYAVLYKAYSANSSYTMLVDGKPSAMFGMYDSGINEGIIWMLATTDLDKHKIKVMRLAKPWFELISRGYNKITNMTWIENRLAIHFFVSLGFSPAEVRQYGGIDFVVFKREVNGQCVNQLQ